MGKKRDLNKKDLKKDAKEQPQIKFGRPEDQAIQNLFIKKLKQGKITLINAESEAQIQCHKIINLERKTDKINDKIKFIRTWFEKINQPLYSKLWKIYKDGEEKWEYILVDREDQFPEYLFCDSSDLSYVLYNLLKSIGSISEKGEIQYEWLLFLQLLCFASRDMISLSILKSLKAYYPRVISKMQGMKKNIKEHYEKCLKVDEKRQSDEQSSYLLIANENKGIEAQDENYQITSKQIDQMMDQVDQSQENKSKSQTKKRKGIRKDGTEKRKPQSTSNHYTLNQTQFQAVANSLAKHIAWAYRYIYPEQLKNTVKKVNID